MRTLHPPGCVYMSLKHGKYAKTNTLYKIFNFGHIRWRPFCLGLNILSCPRVRTPHPPGYVYMDPKHEKCAKKKTLYQNSNLGSNTPNIFRTKLFMDGNI